MNGLVGEVSYIRATTSNNNTNIEMVGNGLNFGKGAIWATFNNTTIKHYGSGAEEKVIGNLSSFEFDYDIDFGDSFAAAGILFNLSGSESDSNYLEGLFLSFNYLGVYWPPANSYAYYPWRWFNVTQGYGSISSNPESIWVDNYFYHSSSSASLWKVRWDKNDCKEWLKEENVTLIRNLALPTKGHLKIEVIDDEYKITESSAAEPVFVYRPETMNPNSFGFGSVHYSHGCPGIGRFDLKNVSVHVNLLDT